MFLFILTFAMVSDCFSCTYETGLTKKSLVSLFLSLLACNSIQRELSFETIFQHFYFPFHLAYSLGKSYRDEIETTSRTGF